MAKGKIKIVAYMSTLMHYARELGQAKLSGDTERIAKAQKAHDDYHALCLDPEVEVQTYIPVGWANPR